MRVCARQFVKNERGEARVRVGRKLLFLKNRYLPSSTLPRNALVVYEVTGRDNTCMLGARAPTLARGGYRPPVAACHSGRVTGTLVATDYGTDRSGYLAYCRILLLLPEWGLGFEALTQY